MIPTAWAAEKQVKEARSQTPDNSRRLQPAKEQQPEEGFEKALDAIRGQIGKAEGMSAKGLDDTAEREGIKAQRVELDSLDVDIRKDFAATEKKLKDSNIPQVILDRHYAFVKHYDDNLKELRANLDGIEKAGTRAERNTYLQKAKAHLEKTKAPSRHQKLDPNNLPHRMVKAKARMPRLKKEQFEKDFPEQKKTNKIAGVQTIASADYIGITPSFKLRNDPKPILLAYNDIASDVPFRLPRPMGETTGGGLDAALVKNPAIERFTPQSAINSTQWDDFTIALAASTAPPTADDLAETPEAQFTQDIKDLAKQLNYSPVKIYEYVKNNIEYVPTYGSIQGADMCLQTRQCNDIDTASLLIALMRTSNISARYVYGTIDVPIDTIKNWVGGFSDPQAALNLIASGGIPAAGKMLGGQISAARIEHVWVEAYIPYGNYRGAIMDQSNKTWIPMDGSFKQYTYTPGFDITSAVTFSRDTYLSQVQSQNAIHYYQSRIQDYLDANLPDKSIVEVKGYREIQQKTYQFLPSTLPYVTIAELGKYSTVPDAMAAKVSFMLSDQNNSGVTYSAATQTLAGKRITISYIPATETDTALISAYGGFLYDVPAYLLNLMPVLKVEGAIQLTGPACSAGADQILTLQYATPGSIGESITKPIYAGAYYAVALDLQGINENVLGKRNYQLTSNVLSDTASLLGTDDLIGEHLHILGTTYFLANDKLYKAGAKLYNTAVIRSFSGAITSFTISVSYYFSIPRRVSLSGVNMDVPLDRIIAVAKDGNVSSEKAYMEITGLVSSYHEHDIFEKIDGFSSVSTVKALQTAAQGGIAIQKINMANIGQMLPALQVSQDIKDDIQNAVNAGAEVTIPQTNILINDWNGTGYIIEDPLTGAGTYRISGGLAGGDSASRQDGMQIVNIFKDAYSYWKNKLDLLTRRNIVTAASIQIGEEILADAETRKDLGVSYEDVGKCTGLVIKSYAAAGIDLVKMSKDAGFENPGNVSVLYLFIQNRPEFAIGAEGPIWGDIVFFSDPNTTRTAAMKRTGDDNVTHVGIVSSVLDGQVYSMIHAANKNRNIVDDIFPSGMMKNSYWGINFLSFGRPR